MQNKIDVLIVDDQQENLFTMHGILDALELEITVVEASSGDEALALMLERDFALVLLDVRMPGMDGFELAELMRGREKTKRVPIIFITAIEKDQRHIFTGYEAGAVDYLFKPIDPIVLKAKVKVFCDLHGQRQIIQKQLKEISEKNEALEKQLAEIKVLRGMLPICSHCKKIRNDSGYWEAIEKYICARSEACFSHGICPECLDALYPELCEEVKNNL